MVPLRLPLALIVAAIGAFLVLPMRYQVLRRRVDDDAVSTR